MAIYKKAIQKLIKPGPTDPRVDVMVGTVGHVAVSMADSLHDWFDGPSGGVESHFYIRLDGTVEQYRDTAYEADAQGGGNSWLSGGKRYGFISYETEGMGSGEWSAAQLASIKDLLLWGQSVHGYPMRKATNPHGPGHGYHALFDEWNRDHHACPGADRIKQFNNVLVPWLASGGDEFDMTPAERQKFIDDIATAVVNKPVPRPGNTPVALGNQVGGANINAYRALNILKAQDPDAMAAAIAAAVAAAQPGVDVNALAKAIVLELGKES